MSGIADGTVHSVSADASVASGVGELPEDLDPKVGIADGVFDVKRRHELRRYGHPQTAGIPDRSPRAIGSRVTADDERSGSRERPLWWPY